MAEREEPISTAAVARIFGVDERTIRNWVAIGCPQRMRSKRPAYLLSEVIPWRRRRDQLETAATEKPDLAVEQARKLRADADLAELKVQERRGELVAAADVERQIERLCSVLRARVLGIRGRWAARVMGLGTMAEAAQVLDDLATDMIEALRAAAEEIEIDDTGAEVVPDGDDPSPEDAAA